MKQAGLAPDKCSMLVLASISGISLYISYLFIISFFLLHKQKKNRKYIIRRMIILLNITQYHDFQCSLMRLNHAA
jgi:hypothetical protein